MCGIAGIVGAPCTRALLDAMTAAQGHRGPDASGSYLSADGTTGLAHARLAIIDLSDAGRQPMSSEGGLQIVFNGEIYNYVELRRELAASHAFRTGTDTEVLLAAYERWGAHCLHRLVGMFAFAIWDEREQTLFAARDRFGVKPFNYHRRADGALLFASEVGALLAAGVPASPDPVAWATYLALGSSDHTERTFFAEIASLPAGHLLIWRAGRTRTAAWYDLAERAGPDLDDRSEEDVREEYLALLRDSVRLRFRADVPVGINLSGGLDSSILLGLVHAVQGEESDVKAFTFVTGDDAYDELPWVERMLERTRHPLVVCPLSPAEVPALAEDVQRHQHAPFGGLPTLAYARVFERARAEGVIVLLDGQGMDEQWAGYDYYRAAHGAERTVQGTVDPTVRPDCLAPEFAALGEPLVPLRPFGDRLRDTQYRDARYTKLPRALRFNDRISMRASTELREPFLDHRLFELALRQPPAHKIRGDTGKWLLRRMADDLLPSGVVNAPKRPLQTPQREWLRGPLRAWATDRIEDALDQHDAWLDAGAVRRAWSGYCAGQSDNSFWVWQWINLSLAAAATRAAGARAPRGAWGRPTRAASWPRRSERVSPEPRFTVVIPTRNRPLGAMAMVRYLRADLGWTCPVVLVDQSDDGGQALARALDDERPADVELLRQRERGTGVARNAGARRAATDWLLLLDDDVRPARGYLEAVSAHVAANPWVDAVQPGLEQRAAWDEYVRDPERWLEDRARMPRARLAPTPAWDGVRWFTNSPRTRFGALTVGVASGNLAIARRAFVGVGGFDEQIEGRGDDSEFGVRLWWYGYRVGILPEPVAFHLREPHGGTRQQASRWERLLAPEPPVGWVYFHLKWFPGTPFDDMRREYLRGALRRPWTLPIRLARVHRATAAARARLAAGPRYLSPPTPRDALVTAETAAVSCES